MLANFDTITELEDSSIFKLDMLQARANEYNGPGEVLSLSFEMNLDLLFVSRDGYTAIDALSDIGGIESIIISGITIFLSVWNYKHFDKYMASHLYKFKGGDTPDKYFEVSKISNIKFYCLDLLPSKCVCCR